jgi:hypothetical protein
MTMTSIGEEMIYKKNIQSYTNQCLPSNTKTKILSQGNLYATFFFILAHLGFYAIMDPIFATTGLVLVIILSLSAG